MSATAVPNTMEASHRPQVALLMLHVQQENCDLCKLFTHASYWFVPIENRMFVCTGAAADAI